MKKEDFEICISLVDDAFEKCMDSLTHEYESKDISKTPWSWYNHKDVYFYTLSYEDNIIAYVIWRIKDRISHLHSFLVSADYQGIGVGSILLKCYEKKLKKFNLIWKFSLYTHMKKQNTIIYFIRNIII